MANSILEERARRYGERAKVEIQFERALGAGTDGAIWKTDRHSAVKAFERQTNYRPEVECYNRLASAGVTEIDGFAVPRLIGASDDLWVIEIEIVTPPFLLDFGKVHLDRPPDYSVEVLDEDEERCREIFEDRWPRVKSLI